MLFIALCSCLLLGYSTVLIDERLERRLQPAVGLHVLTAKPFSILVTALEPEDLPQSATGSARPEHREEGGAGTTLAAIERVAGQLQLQITSKFKVSDTLVLQVNKEQLQRLLVELKKRKLLSEVWANDVFASSGINLVTRNEPLAEDTRVQWNLKLISVPKAWKQFGSTGIGAVYASADTGVDWKHPALCTNYLGWRGEDRPPDHNYAWFDAVTEELPGSEEPAIGECQPSSREPCDDNGHGTHTTSTAVGRNGVGVAPGARWMACRNMWRGVGRPSTYLRCLDWFLAPTDLNGENPRPEKRPDVIGNSYGCPESEGCAPNAFAKATRTLRSAGIVMSVSAGNTGPKCRSIDSPPAHEQLVLTVGALGNRSKKIAPFSSRGPCTSKQSAAKPEVVAPGTSIKGAVPGDQYALLSGTSMATPHLSGILLLLLSRFRACLDRKVSALEDLVKRSAKAIRLRSQKDRCGEESLNAIPNFTYGYGVINALSLHQLAEGLCKESKAVF